MDKKQLQDELTRALDFQYPRWWGEKERQAHRDRIKRLEQEIDNLTK